jgi:hypothetical protein
MSWNIPSIAGVERITQGFNPLTQFPEFAAGAFSYPDQSAFPWADDDAAHRG